MLAFAVMGAGARGFETCRALGSAAAPKQQSVGIKISSGWRGLCMALFCQVAWACQPLIQTDSSKVVSHHRVGVDSFHNAHKGRFHL